MTATSTDSLIGAPAKSRRSRRFRGDPHSTRSPSAGSTFTPFDSRNSTPRSSSSGSPDTSSSTQPWSRVTSARRMLVTISNLRPSCQITGSLTSEGPKISRRRRRPIGAILLSEQASRHSRHDRDLVVGFDLLLQPRPKPHVLVVQVHVHELAQLARLVEQPVA